MSILLEAEQLTGEDRRVEYGDPKPHFELVAQLWSEAIGCNVSAAEVCQCLMLLKVARSLTGTVKRDTYTDICGYARLTVDMQENV